MTPRGDLADDEKATVELFQEAAPVGRLHHEPGACAATSSASTCMEIPQGTGSGFVWDDAGPRRHQLPRDPDGAEAAEVTLSDHSTWDARLVGAEPDKDLAVLHIDAPPASGCARSPSARSADLQVGQKVFAIGNPFGLDHTLTTGIISALGREIESVTGPLDPGRDPDRRGDQPRQLRRPAPGQRRAR